METIPEQLEKEVQNLLNHVSIINKKYDDIVKITGERFNVFEILDLTTDETRTHSAFLAALLNPKGKHGLGSIMLKHFLKNIKFEDFDANSAGVYLERSIGNITKGYVDGGRIDIIIEDKLGHAIIIENKIYAVDQYNQLVRYYNYAKPRYKEGGWKLLYLNLSGVNPSDSSTGSELIVNEHYHIISYKESITAWLDDCKKEATNHPILRETITQYIYLIKKLTGQTTNKNMKNEIVDTLIANGQNISAAIEVSNSLAAAKKKLITQFGLKLKNCINEKNNLIEITIPNDFGLKYKRIEFKFKDARKEFLILSFLSDFSDAYFEILYGDNKILKNKNISNIAYYKSTFGNACKSWGKIEDAEKGWHGEWICRYNKLDRFFRDSSNWSLLADDKYEDLIKFISEDIFFLLKVIQENPSTHFEQSSIPDTSNE